MSTNNLLDRSMSDNIDDWPIYSYSQMQSWDRCEMLWDYAYARNWYKIRKESYLSLGSEVHAALEFWYSKAIERVPKEDRKQLLMQYFSERVNECSDDFDMLPVVNRAFWLCTRYVNEFAPVEDSGHKILATEHHFTVPFKTGKGRNFILQGYIDLLTEYSDRLWAWDHKTMESNFWTPIQVEMEPQTPLYAAALREQGQKVHGVIINMVNTYDYKHPDKVPTEKLFSREKSYRTDVQLDTIVREMKYIVDDIIDEHQTPRRSLRLDCKNCSFQEPCSLRIRGISDDPLLQSDYEQKDHIEVQLKLKPEGLIKSA